MRLRGKVALVTGGGTGLGRAIALAFGEEGAAVAVGYSRSRAEAEGVVRELRDRGTEALAVQADVAREAEVAAMVETVERGLGGVDILVNNAGITRHVPHGNLEALDGDLWDRILAVNLKGALHCVRAVVPGMRARGGGRILNIASVAGLTGRGSSIPYCASKAGLIAMTKSLALALAPEIRVNAIAPGLTETPILEGAPDAEGLRRRAREATPLRRVGQPADVAEVALSLACGWDFVTGQVLVVDGGRTLLGSTLA